MAIPDRPSRTAAGPSGVASGQHQGLHRPNDDQRVEQALNEIGLDDQGDVLEDQLRDRRSRGAPPSRSPAGDRGDASRAPR